MSDDTLQCRYDNAHTNPVLLNVFCSHCQRPLFKIHWWYHAVFLNFSLLTVGLLIGTYEDVAAASLVLGFLFCCYLAILFRHLPISLLQSVLLFLLSFSVIFILTQPGLRLGPFGISDTTLTSIKVGALYLTVVVLFLSYSYFWLFECGWHQVGYVKSIPVLTFGWFLIVLLVYGANSWLSFLNPHFLSLIKQQIYLRELLFALSGSYVLILALTRAMNNKIEVPRVYFKSETTVTYWTESTEAGNLLSTLATNIARPVYNIGLNIYKIGTEQLKAITNFVVYLARLSFERIVDYTNELLGVLRAMAKLFFTVLRYFIREVVAPLSAFYAIGYVLLLFASDLQLHIFGLLALRNYLGVLGLLVAMNILVAAAALFMIKRYTLVDVLQSVFITNTLFTLIIVLYSCIASLELFVITKWLPGLPFGEIGVFTVAVPIALLISILFIYMRLKKRYWVGVPSGILLILLIAILSTWPRTKPPRIASIPHETASPSSTPTPTPTPVPVFTFANPDPISIPSSGTSGNATPYPSIIEVAEVPGRVKLVTVTLNDFRHTASADLAIQLEGPSGEKVTLMSRRGGLKPATLTFADATRDSMSSLNGSARSASIRPSTRLSAFNGTSPNGTWKLFVVDSEDGDTGRINGWKLTISVEPDVPSTGK